MCGPKIRWGSRDTAGCRGKRGGAEKISSLRYLHEVRLRKSAGHLMSQSYWPSLHRPQRNSVIGQAPHERRDVANQCSNTLPISCKVFRATRFAARPFDSVTHPPNNVSVTPSRLLAIYSLAHVSVDLKHATNLTLTLFVYIKVASRASGSTKLMDSEARTSIKTPESSETFLEITWVST